MPDSQYGKLHLKSGHALSLMGCMVFLLQKPWNRICRLVNLEDWRDGMGKESIRQDKELARAAEKSDADCMQRGGTDGKVCG